MNQTKEMEVKYPLEEVRDLRPLPDSKKDTIQSIELRLRRGIFYVRARVSGGLALHRDVRYGGEAWSITHVTSGWAVGPPLPGWEEALYVRGKLLLLGDWTGVQIPQEARGQNFESVKCWLEDMVWSLWSNAVIRNPSLESAALEALDGRELAL